MKQNKPGFQSKSDVLYFFFKKKKKKTLQRVFLRCSYLDSNVQEAAHTSQSWDRRA